MEAESEGTAKLSAANRALFLEKVRLSNAACENGDYGTAVALYTDALQLDPTNHILYSNRSAARLKQGLFAQALQDALTARDLCPTWPKAYYRQGVALQCMGRHGDALAAFSQGLGQDPESAQLLAGLVEASIKSPMRTRLEPTFDQLAAIGLDRSPFVLVSVVGQELLAVGLYRAAATVLEAALRIGTCSLKLRGSVFSALSSAHWALNQLDKAIGYMQQDLAVAKSLGDTGGECRAYGNLGSAYFSQHAYKEALTAHRYQLVLAMKCKESQSAAAALTSLGHVYTAISDYPNALASHKQCVQLVKQLNGGDEGKLQEAREIGNVGAVYLAMGDFESAVDCHTQHLRIAHHLGDQVEEARAYSNLGSSYHFKRNFTQAIAYHEKVLRIAQTIGDKSVEARAYAGLGHAARCAGDFAQAKQWHERQLDVALATRDKVGEGRACSNLGIVYQLLGESDAALKLHQSHLTIARNLQDKAGMGRAYGNIGNAYSAAGYYDNAIKYHKQELTISKEVNDRSSEASTHGNLAVAYQALGAHEMALYHYRAHLDIARDVKDGAGEACALLNLANCLSSRNQFGDAIPYYELYLMLSQELSDVEGEAKACHFLGYAHYCIGNYREAVRYYDQDLALAKDLQDKVNMGRAYCNLGLAHLSLGQLETALQCQKYFLAISHLTNNLGGKFRAMGNIGDVLLKRGDVEEGVRMYQRQLTLARNNRDRGMEAAACGALGLAHRTLKRLDKALGYHTQELTVRQEMSELSGECRAHGHLGAVHMALGNYTHASKCYQEQLERAQELHDVVVEAQAYGNLGIARLNMAHYEDAIGYFEQQLAALNNSTAVHHQLDRGRAFGSLGDCYESLGDAEEAIKCHEQYLQIALQLKSARDQERAYRGLAHAHDTCTNLQQALVCLEKRLVVAHELHNEEAKASAYGDLGRLHARLRNLQQAISCLEHQQNIARDLGDQMMEAESMAVLGEVYQQMGEYHQALRYFQTDLEIGQQLGVAAMQARAFGNLGAIYEHLSSLDKAIHYREQHYTIANTINDQLAKTCALSALGRCHLALNNRTKGVEYLLQGLAIAEVIGRKEEEAKIRHRLGLTLLTNGDLEGAQKHLELTVGLLEMSTTPATVNEDLHSATYRTLQQVLIGLKRYDDALVVTERSRQQRDNYDTVTSFCTLSQIQNVVNRLKAAVLYYSLNGDYLYAWLLMPLRGIIRFNAVDLTADDGTNNLPDLIRTVHRQFTQRNDTLNHSTESLNSTTSFQRHHFYNSSNYSLSSLFSLGSVTSLQSSVRSAHIRPHPPPPSTADQWRGTSAVHALYRLLIEPFDSDLLMTHSGGGGGDPHSQHQLVLVLDSHLFLVPFSILCPTPTTTTTTTTTSSDYLCERYALLSVPALFVLRKRGGAHAHPRTTDNTQMLRMSLAVGNPRPTGWGDAPHSEQEAVMVGELLQQAQVLIGGAASKHNVLSKIEQAECLHFATHINWEMAAIVLAPEEVLVDDGEVCDVDTMSPHHLTDFQLTANEITDLRLSAKLVVINASGQDGGSGGGGTVLVNYIDSLVTLIQAFLTAGAQAVITTLWPIPETATKILLRAFYSSMLQGTKAARALSEAIQTVQHTKYFGHPVNWGGFVLIGHNVRLSNKVALMGQALCQLVQNADKSRDALRVSLHLVEKSLQRIHRGQKNAMYTTQKSIENKVGPIGGWRELLMSVGFRFEPASNGIPSSVFFPQSDPDERLTQCSASLQALLGLSQTSLVAMGKLLQGATDVADDLIEVIQSALTQFSVKAMSTSTSALSMDDSGSATAEVNLSVRLWRVPGCHELLASLGFDLTDVIGQDRITLKTGKQANRRHIQFTLQALLALFDTPEAPKSLTLSSSPTTTTTTSSLESLGADDDDDDDDVTKSTDFDRQQQPSSSDGEGPKLRRRGEPDGGQPTDGAAFTPSPTQQMSMSLVHQSKIRHLYAPPTPTTTGNSANGGGGGTNRKSPPPPPPLPPPPPPPPDLLVLRPDSSTSSANSSLNEWDGCATVLRRRINDRMTAATSHQLRHHTNVLTTNNRELLTPTITEVYHERNIGLGLAPPLAKILFTPSGGTIGDLDIGVTLGLLQQSTAKGSDSCRCQSPRDDGDGTSVKEMSNYTLAPPTAVHRKPPVKIRTLAPSTTNNNNNK